MSARILVTEQGGVYSRLTGRQRAVIAYLAVQPVEPPTAPIPNVAGHVRRQWAQPVGRRGVRRWLHDTFTADMPAGGEA